MNTNRSKCHSRGTSLVEVLIGFGIFTVFIVMLFGLFIWGAQSWRRADTRMQLSQNSVISLDDMAKWIAFSDVRSLRILYYSKNGSNSIEYDTSTFPSAPYCAISFIVPFDDMGNFTRTSANDPEWKAYFIYYVSIKDNTLRRQRVEINWPMTEIGPLDETLMKNALNGDGKLLADDITGFRVIDNTGRTTRPVRLQTNPISVFIQVQKVSLNSEKPETLTHSRMMKMYN